MEMTKGIEIRMVNVENIRTDGPMPRAQIYPQRVADLRKAFTEFGIDRMPALDVFRDERGDLWLANGFHRLAAIKEIGWAQAQVKVHKGTERDARLFTAGAHTNLERNTADLHQGIRILLDDPEWGVLTHAAIGRIVHCSPHVVAKVRNDKHKITSGRKISQTKRGTPWETVERREKFRQMTERRATIEEIAEELKITKSHVSTMAKQMGISLPRRRGGGAKTKNVDHYRMIEDTVLQLEASTAALQSTGMSVTSIPVPTAADWAASLAGSLRTIRSLQKRLKQRAGYEEV